MMQDNLVLAGWGLCVVRVRVRVGTSQTTLHKGQTQDVEAEGKQE